MSRATLLAVLVVLVFGAGLTWYLGCGRDAGGTETERTEELDRLIAQGDALDPDGIDARSLRVRVAEKGADLDAAQAETVVPLLKDHLRALRRNLGEARAAAAAGVPPGDRRRYHIFAAQAHGRFQAEIRKRVSADAARAIFDAYPSMVPPIPRTETETEEAPK